MIAISRRVMKVRSPYVLFLTRIKNSPSRGPAPLLVLLPELRAFFDFYRVLSQISPSRENISTSEIGIFEGGRFIAGIRFVRLRRDPRLPKRIPDR